ncbi:MAG: PEP/pyruvate-binding domain-containing protein, partial [Albidovulum sp.]
MSAREQSLIWFDKVARGDVALVGGKNASLGEMTVALAPKGIRVPEGFATTSGAFRAFLAANRLDAVIRERLAAFAAGRAD